MSAGMDLGIGLVIAGLVFGTLVWALLRLVPNRSSTGQTENIPLILPDVNQSSGAVLVIQAGGRVESINPRARQWVGLRDGDVADIERLARRVRLLGFAVPAVSIKLRMSSLVKSHEPSQPTPTRPREPRIQPSRGLFGGRPPSAAGRGNVRRGT